MNAEEKTEQPDETQQPDQTRFELGYRTASEVTTTDGGSRVLLPGNIHRPTVSLKGRIKDPLQFREALATLSAVVGSDYRYVPKDRSAYMAYRRMRAETAGQNAWQAQQAYFDWLARNDPLAWLILDPIISVHPDRVFFEVFSKDEGVYANMAIDIDAFELAEKPTCGTTNIDFSQALLQGILQMRSYRQTELTIGGEAVSVETEGVGKVLEKKISVPDSWLRGFLQVQSAATLTQDSFSIAPIDLYNALRQLRLHGDRKGKRRGLRVELVPGEKPILVLEPWETVIRSSGDVYKGRQAKVVRVWGRRRLMLLRRLLAFAERIDVHLIGSGLPSFWVLRAGAMTATLGLTGFTSANWSQAVSFDLLLPRRQTETTEILEKAVAHLADVWFDNAKGLTEVIGSDGANLLETMQLGCQHGRIMFDLASQVYRLRPLHSAPLDLEKLEYRNARERVAHDLIARKDAVRIVSQNRMYDVGLELTGKTVVAEDKREYRPQFVLTDEGNISRAECTCTAFRKQGLTAGPCAHLVALRLAYSMEEANRKKSGKARRNITAETRAFSKRDAKGEMVQQISLDQKRVRIRWGLAGEKMRLQNLQFNTVDEARDEYLARLDALQAKGFLDATAG